MYVSVSCKDNKIFVKSPYNEDFVRRARNLSGRWDGRYWVFPKAVESELKKALLRIYGENGEKVARFTVDIAIPSELYKAKQYYALGRFIVARRYGNVVPGEDVALLSDDFIAGDDVLLRVMRVPQHVIDHIDEFIDKDRVRIVNIALENVSANAVRYDHAPETNAGDDSSSASLNEFLLKIAQEHARLLSVAQTALMSLERGDSPAAINALDELIQSITHIEQSLYAAEKIETPRRLSR